MLAGTLLTPLRVIANSLGAVLYGMKESDAGYAGFGEVYFTGVKGGVVKGWKRHRVMTSNLVVLTGEVRIVLHDDRSDSPTRGQWFDVRLGPENYCRLTVPPQVWFAFRGMTDGPNLMMNLASIPHDPLEAEALPLDDPRFGAHAW